MMMTGAILLALLPAAGASWDHFDTEDGIKLWKREVEGTSFVAFRGRGLVPASIRDVAAVIRSADRETEWMANCVDAKTIRWKTTNDAIVYHRTGSPAPFVSDRDVVLLSRFHLEAEKKTIRVTFERTTDPKMPEKEGVVRMPVLQGHWVMKAMSPTSTEVEYQVQADPGGSLPAWLVNLVSKKLPLKTLQGLRKQVTASGFENHRRMLDLSVDWTQFGLQVGTSTTTG